MKNISLVIAGTLLAVSQMLAQCPTVVDNAGVLDAAQLRQEATQLQRFHLKLYYISSVTAIGALPAGIQNTCPELFVSPGVPRNDVIIFANSPKAHKTSLLYGSSLHSALDSQTQDIEKNFMNVKFKEGDYTGGMISGTEEAINYLHDTTAIRHNSTGASTVVINHEPATDLNGLWTFMKWLLIISVFLSISYFLYLCFKNREEKKQAKLDGQRLARSSKVAAIKALQDFEASLNPTDATYDADKASLARMQASLDALTSSSKYDVEADLSPVDYQFIAQSYNRITNRANFFHTATPLAETTKAAATIQSVSSPKPQSHKTHSRNTTVVVDNTKYIDNNPTYIPVPIIVDEPVYRKPERVYEAPSRSESTDYGSSTDYSSSSSSSDFGSSSDYSSSSSSFDSGSSSDFGSSSDY